MTSTPGIAVPFELTIKEIRSLLSYLNSVPAYVLQHPQLIGLSRWLADNEKGDGESAVSVNLTPRMWQVILQAAESGADNVTGAGSETCRGVAKRLKDVELSVFVANAQLSGE